MLLTVVLLAAAGLVLYARLHHGPLRVTSVVISREVPSHCGVVATGRIATNGEPGVVAYRWLFAPGGQPGQRLEQSVPAGQHVVLVTVAVTGSGRGSVAQRVRLQVESPGRAAASAVVHVKCGS